MMLDAPSPFVFPLRIVSNRLGDSETINALTPGPRGPNLFSTKRAAGGVCADLRRKLAPAHLSVVDALGSPVPDEAWSVDLAEARGTGTR